MASVQTTSSSSVGVSGVAAKDYSSLASEVRSAIAPYGGNVAVEFISLEPGGGGFSIEGDRSMLSASMLKVPILCCLFDEIAIGNVSLDDTRVVQASDVAGGAGTGLRAGQELTVERLTRLMIAESDNTAANTLITLLGGDKLNAYFRSHGLDQTVFDHSFMASNPPGDNLTSARDLATLFRRIALNEAGTGELCDLAQEMLLQQSDDDAMVRGLPSTMKAGHKTGSLSSARHDGGIIYDAAGEPLCVLVVMTQGIDDSSANKLIAQVTNLVCAEM